MKAIKVSEDNGAPTIHDEEDVSPYASIKIVEITKDLGDYNPSRKIRAHAAPPCAQLEIDGVAYWAVLDNDDIEFLIDNAVNPEVAMMARALQK